MSQVVTIIGVFKHYQCLLGGKETGEQNHPQLRISGLMYSNKTHYCTVWHFFPKTSEIMVSFLKVIYRSSSNTFIQHFHGDLFAAAPKDENVLEVGRDLRGEVK